MVFAAKDIFKRMGGGAVEIEGSANGIATVNREVNNASNIAGNRY